jgi:hypothetical protein
MALVREQAGISKNQVELLMRTANQERHGRPSGVPPTQPMDIGTARDLVSRLVSAWLDLRRQ